MDTLLPLLQERFVWGLFLGLLVTFFVWKAGFTTKNYFKKENKRLTAELSELQGHLNTQLKINASGNETLNEELRDLKAQNETLRVNIATLQQKPDKAELKHLHITEGAVRMMREQAPGFATAWEKALRTSEAEYEDSEKGLSKLVRKILPNYATTSSKPKVIEIDDSSS